MGGGVESRHACKRPTGKTTVRNALPSIGNHKNPVKRIEDKRRQHTDTGADVEPE